MVEIIPTRTLIRERKEKLSQIRQTITISQRGDLWFASSEDEPPIFCSAYTRDELNIILAHALTR